jgi:hypothetical protein
MNGYVPVLPNIPAPTQMGNFNHAQQEDIYMDADSSVAMVLGFIIKNSQCTVG